MDGSLQEKRKSFRLHYATLIRAIGAGVWLLHLVIITMLCLDPHFELDSSNLSKDEIAIHRILVEYRSKRVYFVAAEHIVIMWNVVYCVTVSGSGSNRIWVFVWMHYNWTAVPLLSMVIVVVEFASQDMSYYNVIDDCKVNEVIVALMYFMLGFNAYLLAYNQLRMLQQQMTRPFKPGWVVQHNRGAPGKAATAGSRQSVVSRTNPATNSQLKRSSVSTDQMLDWSS
ncbi:hypothetical protein BOX15_Mlig014856g2 [Macrostomum lignano]|uniref:Uncharacterized protein n=2 Tax=Macrostomum lignano TaxID=282301 RepID=A0A267H0I6_9PLAT|nr:hypothetical protein BOX15_Mlig014856g2 [Macrostomum lignano]